MSGTVDLDLITDELYGLLPGEFTAARDARAAEARKAGDKDVAGEIKKLRRPTTSAWLVNQLVRQRPDEVGELLDLGESLRQAQEQLDAGELRRLGQERHRVVSSLLGEVRELATANGQPLSAGADREVQSTLEAALADPVASDGLRTGRLTGPMAYSGLGSVDLAEVVALPARPPPHRPPLGSSKGRAPGPKPTKPATKERAARGGDATQRRQEIDAAKRAVQDAESAARDARRDAGEQERVLERARKKEERLRRQIDELKQQLAEVRAEEVETTREIRQAERALETAERAVRVAEAQATRASDQLERAKR